jgi:hypothetical protein
MPRDTKDRNDTVDAFIDKPADGQMGLYYQLPNGDLAFFDASTAPFGLVQHRDGQFSVVRMGLVTYSEKQTSREAARRWIHRVRGDKVDRQDERDSN